MFIKKETKVFTSKHLLIHLYAPNLVADLLHDYIDSLGQYHGLRKQAGIKTVTTWSHQILDPFLTLQTQAPVLAFELDQTDLQATYPINQMTTAPQSPSCVAPAS